MQDLRTFVRFHLKQRAYDHPAPDEGLGVVPLGYEPDAFEQAVRAFGDRYDVVEEGRVAYRRTTRPILSVSSRTSDPVKRLLIVSGIHGNEQAGIVCIPEILERYDRDGPVAMRVLTPVNAIGAAELSRFNADGYDINRDFIQFRTEEARLVRRVFDEFRPGLRAVAPRGPAGRGVHVRQPPRRWRTGTTPAHGPRGRRDSSWRRRTTSGCRCVLRDCRRRAPSSGGSSGSGRPR